MQNKYDPQPSGHIWTSIFHPSSYEVTPAQPLLIMFWVLLIAIFFRNTVYAWLTRNFSKLMKIGEIEVDEGLNNYFTTLDDHDRNWSIKEEENARNNLKLRILTDDDLNKLRSTTLGNQHLEGIHSYDILANPLYLDDF